MKMVGMIVKLAPLAAFGTTAFTLAKFGPASLWALGRLIACVFGTCAAFVLIVLGLLLKFNGINIWKFLHYIREELFIVLSAASSEPALPRLMARMEGLGCSKPLVGLVLPAGYSLNLDGTSIFLTMGALYIAQATNLHLTFNQELTVFVVCLLTSKGAAGVVGSAFITLTATLSTLGTIPVEGMALILGVDPLLAVARSMTNLVGNSVAMIVIARWENDFDDRKAAEVLNS
jgi:aerobic C4-dicarboxylate transport protein